MKFDPAAWAQRIAKAFVDRVTLNQNPRELQEQALAGVIRALAVATPSMPAFAASMLKKALFSVEVSVQPETMSRLVSARWRTPRGRLVGCSVLVDTSRINWEIAVAQHITADTLFDVYRRLSSGYDA